MTRNNITSVSRIFCNSPHKTISYVTAHQRRRNEKIFRLTGCVYILQAVIQINQLYYNKKARFHRTCCVVKQKQFFCNCHLKYFWSCSIKINFSIEICCQRTRIVVKVHLKYQNTINDIINDNNHNNPSSMGSQRPN